jgi:hypothetical protein
MANEGEGPSTYKPAKNDNSRSAREYKQEQAAKQRSADARAKVRATRAAGGAKFGTGGDKNGSMYDLLAERENKIKSDSDAARQTAINNYKSNNAANLKAAKNLQKTPIGAPNMVGSLGALQDITNVSVNSKNAGANKAKSQYFIQPDDAKSAFAVGAGESAGSLGVRNKASTDNLNSKSRHISGGRKDQF